MKITNLLLTSTLEMNREQWLEFREPKNHVNKWLGEFYQSQVDSKGMKEGYLYGKEAYDFLKYAFNSDQWKEYIFPCIGGSEMASVTGHSPYKSVIELYYEKVGLKEVYNDSNAAMYWGSTLEETIAQQWQFWGGSFESLLLNAKLKKVIRKCRRINAYVQNIGFPWIFVSLDRIINKHDGKEEGALECKTISGWAAEQWEHGIPPMYVVQLQTQLMTLEFLYGEMAMLKDGRDFSVIPFDKHELVCEGIRTQSKAFFDMVKAGIVEYFLYQAAPTDELKKEHLANIDRFSPEPDGSLAYQNYLKDAYQERGYEIVGNLEQLHLARAYKHFDNKMKDLENYQRECSNKLKGFMKDAAKLDFGPDGVVTWKANVKGSRVFNVRVSVDDDFTPNPELINLQPLVKNSVED